MGARKRTRRDFSKKTTRCRATVPVRAFLVAIAVFLLLPASAWCRPAPPSLDNNPSFDVTVTTTRPLLTLNNPDGGSGYTYEMELDTSPDFDSPDLIRYSGVKPLDRYITSRRIDADHRLRDHSTYYWRARTQDGEGRTSDWAGTRFSVDTTADDHFMDLVRVPVVDVEVSDGTAPENIVDLNDFSPSTYWQSTPPGRDRKWVRLDLGQPTEVSRIWMLSNADGRNGRLKAFEWLMSRDGRDWRPVPGAAVAGNDTFRNVIDLDSPVTARYLMLVVTDWEGYAVQLNSVRIYRPGAPPVPSPPNRDYVLVIGNQQDGGTFTELASFIRSLEPRLATLTVPFYEVSAAMLRQLAPQPVAIVLSGSLSSYNQIPMYEYNGEYEIIRTTELPIFGICCGHQQLAMAQGYSFVRGMGWEDLSSLEPPDERTRTEILQQDPLFEEIPDPFVGVEVHGWSIGELPEGYELLAESTYVQSIKHENPLRYGTQFHPEIRRSWNQAAPVLENFLDMVMARRENHEQ